MRYLAHLREAWNQAHPDAPFDAQDITVTIPASFDPAARELTAEAARAAGYGALTLLEEPQAALYSWIQSSQGTWRKEVKPGDLILVVDVGGGTSDFSLIAVLEREGNLELQRVAVGDHILLGGDNMDLALALRRGAQACRPEGTQLDAWQMRALDPGLPRRQGSAAVASRTRLPIAAGGGAQPGLQADRWRHPHRGHA